MGMIMKNKITIVILSILLIISVALNIYEYNNINTLKSQCTTLQSDIDSLNNEITSLNDTISANEDEITALSSEKADLENSLEELQAENETLQAEKEQLQTADATETSRTIDNLDDIDDEDIANMTQEEKDALVDAIMQEVLEENGYSSGGHIEGNPVEGATPSNPDNDSDYQFGSSGSEGIENFRIQ
jgi:TolA-binding protein